MYNDITNKLGEPLWWDHNGVPRYEDFKPSMLIPHIEFEPLKEAILAEICCPKCGKSTIIGGGYSFLANPQYWTDYHGKLRIFLNPKILTPHGEDGRLKYCCSASRYEEVIILRVIEYWSFDGIDGWLRNHDMEGTLSGDDDYGDD